MITVSVGGIPIYLVLIKLVTPDPSTAALPGGFLTILPVVLFLMAAVICAIEYMPKITQQFSVGQPNEVMYALGKLSITGWWFALVGLGKIALFL